jgi:hypothetical protein
MPTSRRRPDAPPPPRTTDVADPLAPTAAEWREQEREKADRRRAWGLRFALVLSLPFLAGGVYALPLAYLWRVLCVRVPGARRWGVLLALPALAAAALAPGAVLGPTRDLLLLPVAVGPGLPADHVVPLPFPLEVGAPAEVGLADPFPPLRGHLTASWRPGLVWAALLCAGWGVGGFLGGAKLRPRSAAEIIRAAERALKHKAVVIEPNLVLRGFITMLYAKQGTGKTERACALVRNHPDVRFYWLSEQTDDSFGPFLQRWGLGDAPNLHVMTRDKADALWEAHGHATSATWDHLGPMVLDQAGRLGADVFIMDTWTAWTGGAQDAKSIQVAMSPIRKAAGKWHYAVLTIGHTNKEGILLGSKEFERLCDISAGMDVVEGTQVRRVTWVKDRSPAEPMHEGDTRLLVRDLDAFPPGYREPTPQELSGGGVGGVVQVRRNSNSPAGGKPTAVDKVREALAEGPATVKEVQARTGLSQPAVSGALTTLEAEARALRIGKRGQAELWRGGGSEDGSEDAEAGGDGDASRTGAGGAAAAAGGDAGGGAA